MILRRARRRDSTEVGSPTKARRQDRGGSGLTHEWLGLGCTDPGLRGSISIPGFESTSIIRASTAHVLVALQSFKDMGSYLLVGCLTLGIVSIQSPFLQATDPASLPACYQYVFFFSPNDILERRGRKDGSLVTRGKVVRSLRLHLWTFAHRSRRVFPSSSHDTRFFTV